MGMIATIVTVSLEYYMLTIAGSDTFVVDFIEQPKEVISSLDTVVTALIWTVSLFQLTFDLAHWIFVLKYWNLSLKI